MTSSKLLSYPFTFTSTVSVYLKPYSDIEDPDTVVIELLNAVYEMECLREHDVEKPDELTSKAIKKLEVISIHLVNFVEDKKIKILQAPKNESREEPYICEITHKGGFVLGKGIKSELAEKMIEIGVVNMKQDLDSVLSTFNDATGDYYVEYEDTLDMAHHSMQVISKRVFNISEPISYKKLV